jgi:glycosyltransferase involved in cell wall biosynthesis
MALVPVDEVLTDRASVRPQVSLFFPVYRDEATVARVTDKALRLLDEVASRYEVIIVDDGSPDASGAVADEIAARHEHVRVIHHPRNLGYGAALRTGFSAARYEWICFTDGDDEYEVADLRKLLRLKDHYDLIITFRYAKRYSSMRIVISYVYNRVLRFLFQTKYRDISCGLRLIRRDVVQELDLISTSPFIGAEIAIKTLIRGFRVGEVGVQTFPREFGKGSSTSMKNIIATIKDMLAVYRRIFSPDYDVPPNRR